MELGPIALAGPDEDCVPSTGASSRRSPFSRLGSFPAALQGRPHGHRAAQRCQLLKQQQQHHSLAGSHSRPVAACVTESRVAAPRQHAAEQASQPVQAPAAKAISKQPSADSRLGGSSQPAKPSRRKARQDGTQRLPFAAASLRGGGEGGRKRPVAASPAGRGATLVLASVPHASYLFAEAQAPALASLLVLSDTVRHVFAGTAARTMAQALIHPLDTVKTRLQVRTPEGLLKTWRKATRQYPFDFHVGPHRIVHARNVLISGPADVYLGLTGAVLGTIPTAAIYFGVYEWCKGRLESRGWTSAATHLGSASVGACMSALVRVPTDTLKHRVQAYLHHDIFDAARTITADSGVLGLYRGFWPTLLRDVPEIAIQFTLYERLRKVVGAHRGEDRLRTWQHLVLGGLSGGVAASVTMPLDYVKTATQCGSPMSVRELLEMTLKEKGPRGFFRGWAPRVAQTAIMSAVFFTLFEAWKAALKRDRQPEDKRLNVKMWRKRRSHVWKRQFVHQ